MTIMPAHAVRPGDTIIVHPDHHQPIRYRVVRGAYGISCSSGEVGIDYTAPADEVPGLVPNDHAVGVLVLPAGKPCQIDRADPRALPAANAGRPAGGTKEATQ